LPRFLTPSCRASGVGFGFPLGPHLRLHRRWIFESPRISHPSAVPTDQLTGLPQVFSLSVSPTIHSPSCPASWIFRYRLMDPRVASVRAPSGCAFRESPGCPASPLPATSIDQFPGCPKSRVSQRCRLTNPPGCPGVSALRRYRFCFLGLPRLRIYGWVDDESPTVLELCIIGLRRG